MVQWFQAASTTFCPISTEMKSLSDIWEASSVPSLSEEDGNTPKQDREMGVSVHVPPESCLFMHSLLFLRTCL